jgi:hypothetical protein
VKYIHDWNWSASQGLRYFSRVAEPTDANREVWILCEYAVEKKP